MQSIKIFNQSSASLLIGLLLISLLFSGCNSTPPRNISYVPTINCSVTNGKSLVQAVSQTRQILSESSCQMGYDSHFNHLVEIAAGDPAMENLDVIGEFSRWAVDTGIITRKQGEMKLRRYFAPQLVALEYHPDFSTYGQCSLRSQQDKINTLLKAELDDKKRGLLNALGDKKGYQQVVKEYQGARLLLESTGMSCQQVNNSY